MDYVSPLTQRRGLFYLLMIVSKQRKGGVAKSQKDKHLFSSIHPQLLLIPELFYLHSSFFFRFIWYLCIYLLTLQRDLVSVILAPPSKSAICGNYSKETWKPLDSAPLGFFRALAEEHTKRWAMSRYRKAGGRCKLWQLSNHRKMERFLSSVCLRERRMVKFAILLLQSLCGLMRSDN